LQRIRSDALRFVDRALGISDKGAPVTEIEDGRLIQQLDVSGLIRRGRSLAGSTGIFNGLMSNTHAVADTQQSIISPYNVTTGAIAPYPVPVPDDFDIWLLEASCEQESGTGTFAGGLFVDYAGGQQGWGIDQAGAAVVRQASIALARWDAVVTISTVMGITEEGNPRVQFGLRLARSANTRLLWRTVSSAAAVFNVQILLGLFPIGLGQDALV